MRTGKQGFPVRSLGAMLLLLPSATGVFANFPAISQPSAESGAYDIYFNGVKKGFSRYRFETSQTWTSESSLGTGSESKATYTFTSDRPQSAHLEVTGVGALKVAYEVAGQELVQRANGEEKRSKMLSGGCFYYPQHPLLLTYLLDRYDAARRGFQALPAIDLVKGQPRDIKAELSRTETRAIAGRTMRVRLWRLESPPTMQAVVYTDEANRPLYWRVPGMQYEVVRQGFEALRPSYRYEKTVSAPIYKVKIEKDVWIPMRDGVRLMADVYRPDTPGKFPVLFQRTCYDRSEFGNADGEFYAQRGYVYVTQHVRGRGGSEGEFIPCLNEAVDGYDSVRWCGTQPWSNGRVGTLGASYNGFCEWMTARTRPQWLKAMIATVAMAGPPNGAPWDGGAFYFGDFLNWFGLLRDKAKVQPFNADMTAAQNTLPILEADKTLFGKKIDGYRFWLDRTRFDAATRQASYRLDIGKVDLPVLHISSWHDGTAIGSKLNYLQMVANGRKHQKLIWGPWDHFSNRESRLGESDFGPDAYIDLKTLYLRWFDHWLKGRPNGIDTEPPVDVFLLGENRWHHGSAWPAAGTAFQKWFLQGTARGRSLAPHAPDRCPPARYTYDPAAYIFSPTLQESFFYARLGADDVGTLCKRNDQLVYDTAPLRKTLVLSGPVKGRLYAATSAVDTDWVMALVDVYPNGKALPLCNGFVRAQFRNSFTKPTLLQPNRIYTYDIDMWQTGIAIPKGHRLRLVVSSTLFPDSDRNLNTGEPAGIAKRIVVATQSIYQDASHASYVVLPVLQGG